MSSRNITTTNGPVTGSGPDALTLWLAEDQYLGNCQFTVSVDGQQIGGIQTVTAIQSADQDESFVFEGNWGDNATVTIDFINFATNNYVGNGNERELYIDSISYDGTEFAVPEAALTGDFPSTSSVAVQVGSIAAAAALSGTAAVPGAVGSSLDLTGYHLTYDEEFDSMPTMSPIPGEAQFTTTLSAYPYSQGMRILSNGDQQYYTDATTGDDPFSLVDGALDITATDVGSGNTPDGGGSTGPSYTSGQITTEGAFSQQYGYFEMRAEFPQGAGLWPQFWMLDNNSYLYNGWPPELDALEAFGAPAADDQGGGATQAHWDIHSSVALESAGNWATLPNGGNEYTAFHTYGVLWTPQTIAFYIDGIEIAQAPTPSDFTQQMYLIVNLAVGGTWPGNATGENGTMKIDYLRAYSDNASIPAVALQQISSPDGNSDTDLYGATALTTGTTVATGTLCFLAGTLIATSTGEQPVERLKTGQQVRTASGESRPIVWIGEGCVLATRGRRNPATPVIVRKGALAPNVPHSDLRVTRGHSLFIDQVLIPVEFLVNHRSILWDDRAQEVSIYHIELETHDVLLANGMAAESYRDDGNRWLFRNANDAWGLPPKPPCAPVLTGGPVVDAVWRRLLNRSGRRPDLPLTDDPDVHLLVDGQWVRPSTMTRESCCFRLRRVPANVKLVSRAAVPQELGLARDHRALGIALRRIVIRQSSRIRIVEAHDRLLTEGYHCFESEIGIRWTQGNAVLPSELFDGLQGPLEVIVHLGGATQYIGTESIADAAFSMDNRCRASG